MNHTRWINKALLASALLAASSTGMRMAHAQDAGANGAAAPISNTASNSNAPVAATTTTTTPGIPPLGSDTASSNSNVAMGQDGAVAAAEVAPEGAEARGGLPNTGGEPLLMSLAGLALAGGALGLRRKVR